MLLGTTTVTCNSIDASGNAATPTSFTVTVIIPVATQAVINEITALPTPVTLSDATAVATAASDYAGLSAAQQALVTNSSILTADQTEIASLQAAAAALAQAKTDAKNYIINLCFLNCLQNC